MVIYQNIIGNPPASELEQYQRFKNQIVERNARIPVDNTVVTEVNHDEVSDPLKGQNFKALCDAGAIVMTPYVRSQMSEKKYTGRKELVRFSFTAYSREGFTSDKDRNRKAWGIRAVFRLNQYQMITLPSNPILPVFPDPDTDGLVLRALSDANAATVDLLTELVELPGTLATPKAVADLARDILSYKAMERNIRRRLTNGERLRTDRLKDFLAKAKKTANPFDKGSLSALFADAWMLYRFGISPVIGTFEDIVKAMETKERVFFSTAARDLLTIDEMSSEKALESHVIGSRLLRATVRSRVDTTMRSHAQMFGINPVLTAWELVPSSWLIDRFISVGDFIQAHSTPPNITGRRTSVSFKDDYAQKVYAKITQPEPVTVSLPRTNIFEAVTLVIDQPDWARQILVCERTVQRYKRVVVGSTPVTPTITFTVSGWSLSMFGDAFALATQKLRR